jgi:hypothetical protein
MLVGIDADLKGGREGNARVDVATTLATAPMPFRDAGAEAREDTVVVVNEAARVVTAEQGDSVARIRMNAHPNNTAVPGNPGLRLCLRGVCLLAACLDDRQKE